MLVAPAAGVGGVHPDHGDTAAGSHADQPGPKLRGGDTGHGAAQSLCAFPAAEGFPARGPRVGEVQILDHDRCAVVVLSVVEQMRDRRTHPPITPGRTQIRGEHVDVERFTDRVT